MSPTPLIELQRRLAEAGRIRMGEKSDKGAPKRLTTWRITSPDESLIRQAAGLYGGIPGTWESPTGLQYEVITSSSELPVLVMPGYSFRQGYEFRTSPTRVERRCDGIELDDGAPCLCNAEGADKCDLITRLTVALPELTTMLGWRLETKGDSAARELLASMDLIRGVSGGRPFVPAKLKIVERRGNVDGQAVRYVVPVVDVQVRYAEILGGEIGGEGAALPAGYTPIEAPKSNGSSLAESLAETETQTVTRTSRSAAPIPSVDDDIEFVGAPLPPADDAEALPLPSREPDDATPTGGASASPDPTILADQLGKLVGSLRRRKAITNDHLWTAVATRRNVDVEVMIELLKGRDGDGKLHWVPLRDDLQPDEIADLHGRLSRLNANVGAAA